MPLCDLTVHLLQRICHCLNYTDVAHIQQVNTTLHNKARNCFFNIDLSDNNSTTVQRLSKLVGNSLLHHNVHRINLQFSTIQDTDMHMLQHFDTLTELVLDGCQSLTDAAFTNFDTYIHSALTHLSLYWCVQLTSKSVVALSTSQHTSSLTRLSLSGLKYIDDASVGQLLQHCRQLVHLDLTRCQALTDQSLLQASQTNAQLISLKLYACSALSDAGISAIGKSCHQLRHIDITGMNRLTDSGLQALAAGCANMNDIRLTWCINLHDDGVCALAQHMPYLRYLSLHGCIYLTERSLDELSRHCKLLTAMDVNGIPQITHKKYDQLKPMFPHLKEELTL